MEMSGKNYRRDLLITIFLFVIAGLSAQVKMTRQQYIEKYADIAMREMSLTGIPASITLAQGCLESDNGNSTLAAKGNNHFGIKCHEWEGKKIFHDDDELDECFRKYKSDEESFTDHSEFLVSKPRYAELFELREDDYKGWARGLKNAGYATSNKYADLLISIIEENELYAYDQLVLGKKVKQKRPDHDIAIETVREILIYNRIEYIVVEDGDNPASLRKELNLYPGEIVRYNNISKDLSLENGMRIYLQPKRFKAEKGNDLHTLKENETMWDISQNYGVRLKSLYRMNNIAEGVELEPGTVIWLRHKKSQDKLPVLKKETSTKEAPKMQMEFDEF